jgi:membrane dipeptidase
MTGGVIGIGYFKGAICSLDPKDVAKAIAHVRDVVGIDYVGLGSDFDGRRRSVSTRARWLPRRRRY